MFSFYFKFGNVVLTKFNIFRLHLLVHPVVIPVALLAIALIVRKLTVSVQQELISENATSTVATFPAAERCTERRAT